MVGLADGADVLDVQRRRGEEALGSRQTPSSPWDGTFQIAYNSDGGHQTWVDAVTNSIKNTLGIDASGAPYVDFATLRGEVNNRTIKTAFRTGWQADYPGLYNFLGPLYATDAGSNDGDYSNPEFDDLLAKGIRTRRGRCERGLPEGAGSSAEGPPRDPAVVLQRDRWLRETVDNVVFGWNSVPLYYEITKAE